jgi:hypothetical protein
MTTKNYFQCFEDTLAEYDDEYEHLDNDDEEESAVLSIFRNEYHLKSLEFSKELYSDKDGDDIRKGLQNNTTLEELTLKNFNPTVLEAIYDGLTQNKTVQKVILTIENYFSNATLPIEAVPPLRKMLSLPGIKFDILRGGDANAQEILRGGSSGKNIAHLHLPASSKQTDDVVHELRDNKIIETIKIGRADLQLKCTNFSFFGNFAVLKILTLSIRSDELESLCQALKHSATLENVDLSNSRLSSEHAHHLADLIQENTSISTLLLVSCEIDDIFFDILCRGLARNKGLKALHLGKNPFSRLDATNFAEKKNLVHLEVDSFDVNMGRLFEVERLKIFGTICDGLKDAKIKSVTCRATEVAQITNLFKFLDENRRIKKLTLHHIVDDEHTREVCRQLKLNKTLKIVDISCTQFTHEISFKLLCEIIEVNDTLEGLYHYGHFLQRQEDGNVYRPEYSVTPLFTALTKNTTLKIVDFQRLKCEDWEVAQVLKINKLLVFASWDQRPGSRANKFISVNQSNQKRRANNIKCNVMSLARSHLSRALPIELWQLILEDLEGTEVDFFDMFKTAQKTK